MAITHTYAPTYRTGSGSVTLPSETLTGDQEINTEVTIAGNATDYEVNIDFEYAKLNAYVIKSTLALTLETNAIDGAGGDVITIPANKALIWRKNVDLAAANLFTANVTKFYLTNASATSTPFTMYALLDQTPA